MATIKVVEDTKKYGETTISYGWKVRLDKGARGVTSQIVPTKEEAERLAEEWAEKMADDE